MLPQYEESQYWYQSEWNCAWPVTWPKYVYPATHPPPLHDEQQSLSLPPHSVHAPVLASTQPASPFELDVALPFS